MMKWKVYFVVLALVMPVYHAVQAATLIWDAQLDSNPLTVERSTTQLGPYAPVATLPGGTTSYILTPGAYGWYRVRYSAFANSVPSNVVQFSLDLYTGLVTDRLDVLEARVSTSDAWVGTFGDTINALQARVTVLEAGPRLELSDGPPAGDTRLLSCVRDVLVPSTVTCYQVNPTLDSGTTPPAPSIPSNLTVRQIDADHIGITCNGIGISTTGTGTRRVMECRH